MARPQILHIDDALVDNAVTLWRSGQLVAIPTETVYGLGADATNGQAVAKIYAVKARPQFNPLIVHVADVETAKRYVEWNEAAEKLAQKFWPGPLTLVLKRRADSPISELVTAGGETLAIRVPAHPVALQLLRAFNGGIAAPSANRSGRVSPTTAEHVREEFGDALPLIIDGGACEVGLESTVLDLSGDMPTILRPGAVTWEMVEEVIGERWQVTGAIIAGGEVDSAVTASTGVAKSRSDALPLEGGVGGGLNEALASPKPPPQPSPSGGGPLALARSSALPLVTILKSPGQLESHYAPSIPVRLNVTEVADDEALLAFGPSPLLGAATTLNLSEGGGLLEAAANLFAYLRSLDNAYHRAIAVMPIPNVGVGEAINDRLARAAVRE